MYIVPVIRVGDSVNLSANYVCVLYNRFHVYINHSYGEYNLGDYRVRIRGPWFNGAVPLTTGSLSQRQSYLLYLRPPANEHMSHI